MILLECNIRINNRFGANYDRSLSTKDIEGAVTNTLISKVVKNKEAAIAQRSGS